MNFEHIFNVEEVVSHLATAFGGTSQFDGQTIGLAFAGRMINNGVRTVDPDAVNAVFEKAAQMLVGEEGDHYPVWDDIWEGFEKRFAWYLEAEGALSTYFCAGGEDLPEGMAWAKGEDKRDAYGIIPAKYTEVRGKGDTAWQ